MISAVIASLATGLLVPATRLNDLYVDQASPNCSTGTGTPGDPVCTISAAIALAADGDRIFIAPGHYVENLVIDRDLELIGTGGATLTTIDGDGMESAIVAGAPPDALVSLTIEKLTVTGGRGASGGGIRSFGSLTLQNSTISGNYSQSAGGGIYHSFGALRIEGSRIVDNLAESGGGGVFAVNCPVQVHETSILENESLAGGGGGLYLPFYGTFSIDSSTIAGNGASERGGGCLFWLSRGTIVNSTLSGNTTDGSGGGFYQYGYFYTQAIDLDAVTITNNHAQFSGGGVHRAGGNPSIGYFPVTTAANSIIAGNTSALGPPDWFPGISSLGGNLVGTGGTGFGGGTSIFTLDPLLAPLADNGGPTMTHALLPGSQARDAADPTMSPSLDQRGLDRLDGAPDIGAFEKGASLCDGDGGDQTGCTPCPCSNNAPSGTVGGCLNSTGNSARLSKFGDSSLGAIPSLAFGGSGLVPGSFAVLISGSALAPENPAHPCFGLGSGSQSVVLDGLRCAIQGVLRHGSRAVAPDGTIGLTTPTFGPNVGGQGLGAQAGFQPGVLRFFQCFYREIPGAGCQTQINTTQALRIVFVP